MFQGWQVWKTSLETIPVPKLYGLKSWINHDLLIPVPMTIAVTSLFTFHPSTIRAHVFPPKTVFSHKIINTYN